MEALQQAAAGLRAAAQARSSRYNYSMPYNPDEYYAEEQFSASSVRAGRVYSGPLLFVGFSIIMGCFCMSTVTKVGAAAGAGLTRVRRMSPLRQHAAEEYQYRRYHGTMVHVWEGPCLRAVCQCCTHSGAAACSWG